MVVPPFFNFLKGRRENILQNFYRSAINEIVEKSLPQQNKGANVQGVQLP
jgi:hypothetical protein